MNNERLDNAINAMDKYVNDFSCTPEEFAEAFGRNHRTLQQTFTGVCLAWLKFLAERKKDGYYDLRNQASVELAAKIVKQFGDEMYLPLI